MQNALRQARMRTILMASVVKVMDTLVPPFFFLRRLPTECRAYRRAGHASDKVLLHDFVLVHRRGAIATDLFLLAVRVTTAWKPQNNPSDPILSTETRILKYTGCY